MNTILTICLIVVSMFLILLYLHHRKLERKFNSRVSWINIKPSQYVYLKNDTIKEMKEVQLETIRKILTLKWVWFWVTKSYWKKRKLEKETFNRMVIASERTRKAKLLREQLKKENFSIEIKNEK